MSTPSASRRDFLKATAAVGVGCWVGRGASGQPSPSPNGQIAFAVVGVSGRGGAHMGMASRAGRLVAVCDVNENNLNKAAQHRDKPKPYTDYRKMLDEMGKSIDAVTIATPDHVHACISAAAMRLGKHVYCEKPLCISVHEARRLGEIAREAKVATQVGNQGSGSGGLRKAVAMIRGGLLGKVQEIHAWTDRPIWPQGQPKPDPIDPPPYLKWDLWLGPAAARPYGKGYQPFSFRAWWDFGASGLGDQANHTMNLPFRACDLRDPIAVEAETPGHNRYSYPPWLIITYYFAATASRPALKMLWYEGKKLPPKDLLPERNFDKCGCLIVGEKGKLYAPMEYGDRYQLFGVSETGEKVAGAGHFGEWAAAIRGGTPTASNFAEHGGPLNEMAMAGLLAVWVADKPGKGPKVEWDAKNQKSPNTQGLEYAIQRPYREGYKL